MPGDNANTLQNIQNSMKYLASALQSFLLSTSQCNARLFVLTLVTGERPEYTEVLDVIKTLLSLPAVTNKLNLASNLADQS